MFGQKAKRAQTSAETEMGERSDPSSIGAICAHRIAKPPNALNVKIGESLTHQWSCSEEYGSNRYALFVRNCEQIEKNGRQTILSDKFGCAPRNASSTARFSINYSISSVYQNANDSVPLSVFGSSQLLSPPFGRFFRIECILSLLPKGPNAIEMPNCSQNLSDREKTLNELLTPAMTHQKRFIDMVETKVSSGWIGVEKEGNDEEQTLAQNVAQKGQSIGTKQRRPFEIWHDQMPISGESEEVPVMALSPFLERAYSIFTSPVSPPIPPSSTPFSHAASENAQSVPFSKVPMSNAPPDTPTVSTAIFNPTTVPDIGPSPAVNHAVPKPFPQTFSPPFGLLPSSSAAFVPSPFILRHNFSENELEITAKEEKRDDKTFGEGKALTEKMEEITRAFVPLIIVNKSGHPFYANSALSHNLPTRHCSWTMLNTALLVWSIFSTLHWLCLLAAKLRSSVVVRRRLKISPKQKMAVAKMGAMKRKMMRQKRHCDGIRQRRNLYPEMGPFTDNERSSPAGKRRAQQKALRTVRQRHLLHRTVGMPMPTMDTNRKRTDQQNDQQKRQLPFPVAKRRQKTKNALGRRLVSNLDRIREEEEEEGRRENHRQKLVIGGRSSEEMTDGSEGKSGKLAEKTAFWDGWAHREKQIEKMASKIGEGQQKQQMNSDSNENMFKFF
ncbi:hypothetical protein niasHS_007465 [Heterodera schachtii]|uniref:ZP domain-containing protein n=1 Tax=Heterodera schachtii TaxID=97005 RepID=A0ABD2JXM3_HETSC